MKDQVFINEMCAKCSTLVIISKEGEFSAPMASTSKDKLFWAQAVREQLFPTQILSEVLYCAFISEKFSCITITQIAHGYHTLAPHPHIAHDIQILSSKLMSSSIILISTPIGRFLPKGIALITGEVMEECAKKGIRVLDHVLFHQNSEPVVSLVEDDMLDYCRQQYLQQVQIKAEK